MNFAIFGLFIILVIVVGVVGAILAAKRKKELQHWAASQDLYFNPAKQYGMDEMFPAFKCLRQGSRRYAHNVTSGQWREREVVAFDYHYETYSHGKRGRRTHHHHFSAVIVTAGIPLRTLFLRPEGFLDKLGNLVGFDDIDFESAEFSRKFYVKSEDRKFAYDVLHPRIMEYLLNMPQYTIQFDENHIIAYRSSRFNAETFQSALDVASEILDQLPEYLRRELKERTEYTSGK